MPTYAFQCMNPDPEKNHNEFEVFQSITSPPLESCPKCDEEGHEKTPPKKLISLSSFVLVGGGWARDNYSK